ncbi:MAG: 2-oxoacid:acceptor oxidoreductase subunit alpha [Alphaproteobacteria bacterium]|nr:MAG: 2-oxoacid:acceptor oxidoreductase subunit alpha [Alphaproteobacteria bacterium]
MSKPLAATNDFVVKFANVNGSGSASANGLFAKVILRMGVPVGARNIFPSNIQGLPTWYEVRISEEGWLGRRGGVDLMVAMNPQTWDADVKSIEPGGYLLYDSSKPLPASKFRDDITIIGAPLTELIAAEFADPRQRQLFKNICYVGVLANLLGLESDALKQLLTEEFKGKDKLIEPNFKAFEIGRKFAEEQLAPIALRVKRADKVGDRIFVEGNEAAGLGAVYGGATFCAWYPITPSTSLAEGFEKHASKLRVDADGKKRYAIVQAEDEIASIGMVMGAGWAGSRAFTCTSGPGISLMNEFVGFSYYAEIPAVIFDVQRGGPSTGMPTRTQQSDLLLAAYASHGDTKHPMLFPANPTECFEFAAQAFDLADFFQTTIFVMLELDVGMQEWLCEPFKWDPTRKLNRGKVLSYDHLEQGVAFGRYRDVDGDAVPYRTYPGTHPTKGSYFTRGSSHDKDARYSERGEDYTEGMQRLLRKWETMKKYMPAPIVRKASRRTPDGVIYIGSTGPAMKEAHHALEEMGVHLDSMRIRGFPFQDEVFEFIRDHEQVFVVEQNRDAQLKSLLVNEGGVHPARLVSILHYDGTPITARFIVKAIADKLKAVPDAALRENVT